MNKPRITELIKENFQVLKERNLSELSAKLAENISWLIATTADGFLRWALYQAPISLIPPEPDTTVFAADDGRIYVNPCFWNAIVDLARDLRRDWADELRFALLHEVAHLLLKHPWEFRGLVSQEFLSRHRIDLVTARHWSNACMDYIVNNFCSDVLPTAELVKSLTIRSSDDLEQFVNRSGATFPPRLKNDLDTRHYSKFSWKDLFCAIVEANEGFLLSHPNEDSEYVTDDAQDRCESLADQDSVQGVHGEQVPNTTLLVRRGVEYGNDDPQETWTRALKLAIVEARQNRKAGTQPGGHLLALERAVTVTIPWDVLVRRELANTLNTTRVISSWSKPSRKLEDYPGVVNEGHPAVMWLLADTSGSMREQLELITGTALSYFRWLAGTGEIRLVPWDVFVYEEITVRSPEDVNRLRELRGGGGTIINPVLDYVLQKLENGQLVVVCTDSCIDDVNTASFREKILRIHKVSGNNVLWLHLGAPSDIRAVDGLCGVKVIHYRD